MSETLVFVLVLAIGSLGLTVGLQALLWATRQASTVTWEPLAFQSTQPYVRVKRVPPNPVMVTRVWLEERPL